MRGGRWLVVAVLTWVGALGTAGCGSGGGGGGAGPEVDRYEATGDVPGAGTIVVSDNGLVALTRYDNTQRDAVVVSDDGGRTWRAADLPDEPAELELVRTPFGLLADGDLVAVLGRDPTSTSPALPVARSEFLVWTTTDGDRWEANAIDTSGAVVGDPALVAMGDVLVASTSTSTGFDVFTSRDRGTSWRRAEVTGLAQAPSEGLELEEASTSGNRLQIVVGPTTWQDDRRQVLTSDDEGGSWSSAPCERECLDPAEPGEPEVEDGRVTTDGGATWHEIVVDPPPRGDEGPYLSRPVEVPGGWLASASSSEASDIDYGMLLRSDDGRSWRQLVPDPCEAGRTNSDVGEPFRFQGRWHATYGCGGLMTNESAVLYDGGTDARSFEPVDGTERENVAFGDPIEVGDRLLLPEYDEDGQLVAFTEIA